MVLAYCTVGFNELRLFDAACVISIVANCVNFLPSALNMIVGNKNQPFQPVRIGSTTYKLFACSQTPTLTGDNQSSARALAVLSPTLL